MDSTLKKVYLDVGNEFHSIEVYLYVHNGFHSIKGSFRCI